MKILGIGLCIILVIACVVQASGAFTADTLVIDVHEDGDATVTFEYSLSWIEQIAVFFRVADPVGELQQALEQYSEKPVRVTRVTDSSAEFYVSGFTAMTVTGEARTYTTPLLTFSDAAEILEKYWFAPFITVDMSPETSHILFPDGYEAVFHDMEQIPSTSHTIP